MRVGALFEYKREKMFCSIQENIAPRATPAMDCNSTRGRSGK